MVSFQKKQWFTLAELIIVITILAVLATIAFVSFQWYSKNSRDGNRVATVKNITKGLDLFQIKTAFFPEPEWDISYGTLTGFSAVTRWYIGENISRSIQMNRVPKDPLFDQKYIYMLFLMIRNNIKYEDCMKVIWYILHLLDKHMQVIILHL